MIKQLISNLLSATIEEPKMLPRGTHRNKDVGHGYERTIRDVFRELGFFKLNTARQESRSRDNQQIDLVHEDEHINGRFPYNVQCKSYSQIVNYHEILAGTEKKVKIRRGPNKGEYVRKWVPGIPSINGIINVILHRYTEPKIIIDGVKNEEKTVFEAKGHYATMRQEDFFLIVQERLELEQLRKKVEELEEEVIRLKNKKHDSTY